MGRDSIDGYDTGDYDRDCDRTSTATIASAPTRRPHSTANRDHDSSPTGEQHQHRDSS